MAISVPVEELTNVLTDEKPVLVEPSPEKVATVAFDLSFIDEKGFFAGVEASGMTLMEGVVPLADLGVVQPSDAASRIRDPRVGMVPDSNRKAIKAPVAMAYSLPRKYGLEFSAIKAAANGRAIKWIPDQAAYEFLRAYEAAEAEFLAAKQSLLDNYKSMRELMLDTFSIIANDARQRIEDAGGVPGPNFHDLFVGDLRGRIPTKRQIRDEILLRRVTYHIKLGSQVLAEQRKVIQERNALGNVESVERAQRIEAWNKTEHERRLQDIERRAREDALNLELQAKAKIEKEKYDAYKKSLEETMSPIHEGMLQVQLAMHEAAKEILKGLKARGGAAHHSQASRAVELADWFKRMNFTNDQDLDRLLNDLRAIGSQQVAGQADDIGKQMSRTLRKISAATYKAAREAQQNGRLGNLQI